MPDKLKEKAVRLLAMREHSRAELARKLSGLGSEEKIDATLDRMAELDLQSDLRFARMWVRSKAERFGTARLRHDLAQRGVPGDCIDQALSEECEENELDRARAVWQQKFGTPARDHREWAKQARFLQSRGFPTGVISKLLKENPDESA